MGMGDLASQKACKGQTREPKNRKRRCMTNEGMKMKGNIGQVSISDKEDGFYD